MFSATTASRCRTILSRHLLQAPPHQQLHCWRPSTAAFARWTSSPAARSWSSSSASFYGANEHEQHHQRRQQRQQDDEQHEPYVSQLQDLFDIMEQNGPTVLGTKDDASMYPPGRFLKCGVPESALRFTTTCYGRLMMAPHVHPYEHRVVMCVAADVLSLTPTERAILREIVGVRRFNEERNELRLSSKQFGSRIENKRHLVSMLDRIILSCRRLAKQVQQEDQLKEGASPEKELA